MRLFNSLLAVPLSVLLLLLFCHSATATPPQLPRHPHTVTFSPDGSLVAVLGLPDQGRDGVARVWTVSNGQIYRRFEWAEPDGMAFSPDSQFLALTHRRGLKIVHLATNQVQWTLDTKIYAEKFFFSPDGKWLVVSSRWHSNSMGPQEVDKELGSRDFEIWHLGSTDADTTMRPQHISQPSFDVQYRASGPTVVGREAAALPVLCNQTVGVTDIRSTAFSTDGKWQAVSLWGPDKSPQKVELWDATSCQLKSTFDQSVWKLWFSPGLQWLLGAEIGQLFVVNLVDGTTRAFTPELGLYSSGFDRFSLPGEEKDDNGYIPWGAISPDEKSIAISSGYSIYHRDNTPQPVVIIYDLRTGKQLASMS